MIKGEGSCWATAVGHCPAKALENKARNTHLKAWKSSLLGQLSIVAVHLSMTSVGISNRRCRSGACCHVHSRSNSLPWGREVGWVVRRHHLNDLGGKWQHPVAFADTSMKQDLANLQDSSSGFRPLHHPGMMHCLTICTLRAHHSRGSSFGHAGTHMRQ